MGWLLEIYLFIFMLSKNNTNFCIVRVNKQFFFYMALHTNFNFASLLLALSHQGIIDIAYNVRGDYRKIRP